MNTVTVDPNCLLQYADRAHTLGVDLADHTPPEVSAHPEQATAVAVLAVHADVAATAAILADLAHGYGADSERAAAMYVATDARNAAVLQADL